MNNPRPIKESVLMPMSRPTNIHGLIIGTKTGKREGDEVHR